MGRGSELQALMSEEDEIEFLQYAASEVDFIEKENIYQYFLIVGKFKIQLLRSRQIGDLLVSGRISFGSLQGDEVKEVVKKYRKLQKWLKDRYCNDLKIRRSDVENSEEPHSKMWVGPNALQHAIEGDITLSADTNGVTVYSINQQS